MNCGKGTKEEENNNKLDSNISGQFASELLENRNHGEMILVCKDPVAVRVLVRVRHGLYVKS